MSHQQDTIDSGLSNVQDYDGEDQLSSYLDDNYMYEFQEEVIEEDDDLPF